MGPPHLLYSPLVLTRFVVSIQLIAPASGAKKAIRSLPGKQGILVSIQLIAPASGARETAPLR